MGVEDLISKSINLQMQQQNWDCSCQVLKDYKIQDQQQTHSKELLGYFKIWFQNETSIKTLIAGSKECLRSFHKEI